MGTYAKHYSDLEVYKRAYKLFLEIHRLSLNFPVMEQYAIGGQIRRASKSISANIAEGFAKGLFSRADYRRYLTNCIGSSDEVQVWIQYAYDLGYISKEQKESLNLRYQEVTRMLLAFHKSIK